MPMQLMPRWLIQKSDMNWYCSEPFAVTNTYQLFSENDPSSLNWFSFTPRNTAGPSVVITMDNIVSVGYQFNTAYTTGTQSGAEVRYFKATAETAPAAPQPYTAHETGWTIQKVRTAVDGTNTIIIGSTYEGALIGLDWDGTALWTNALTGYMNHDLWCDDLTGDQTDEVLIANADGLVYCIDSATGSNLWNYAPNGGGHLPPMYTVCSIESNGTPYVVCGAYDKYIHYLDASGAHVKSIYSQTYSHCQHLGRQCAAGQPAQRYFPSTPSTE